MTEGAIAEIGIDGDGKLFVRPERATFPFIYRAGMQIGWDEQASRLFSPIPIERSQFDWFRQMLTAVGSEYGHALRLTPETKWSSVPTELKAEIEALRG